MAGRSSTTPAASSGERARRHRALHVWGIRHHGPGSARSVRRALDELAPDVVLVELPADAEAALRWVGRPGLVPPVALLGYAVSQPERAVFAPLAAFSPEWQAVAWAAEHGVAVRPIDLPVAVTLAVMTRPPKAALDGVADPDPLAALAAAAGEPDPERWWDDMVEHRGDGEPVFAAVADAMTAVRPASVAAGIDGWREAHMRREIRRALRTFGTVAVICGAWHVPALDPTVVHRRGRRRCAARPPEAQGRDHLGAVDASAARSGHRLRRRCRQPRLVRPRVPSPRPGRGRPVLRRRRPRPAPSRPAGVAGPPHRRLAPGDVAGRPARPAAARDWPRCSTPPTPCSGDWRWSPTSWWSATPSARCHPARPRSRWPATWPPPSGRPGCGPTPRREPSSSICARRTGCGDRTFCIASSRSACPWGILREGSGEQRHVPGDVAAGLGAGAVGPPRRDGRPRHHRRRCGHLVYSSSGPPRPTGWPRRRRRSSSLCSAISTDALEPALRALGELAAHAPDVAELMDALGPVASALRYGDVRGTDAAGLRAVFDELVVRVVAGLDRAARGVDDEAATALIERMSAVQAALAVVDHPARHDEWPRALEQLADDRRGHGLVRGRATRLLHDLGRSERVERRLGQALTPGTPPSAGAAFVEGFLAGSGTILLHDTALLATVDEWIGALPPDRFADVVPLLRRTFGAFEPAERRQLGRLLSHGEVDARPLAATTSTPTAPPPGWRRCASCSGWRPPRTTSDRGLDGSAGRDRRTGVGRRAAAEVAAGARRR